MTDLIVALGDSLTAGYGLRREDAYPTLLQARLDAHQMRYRVINAGVSGDTTAAARRRLSTALAGDVRLVVVALGINDGLRGLPVADVRDNLAFTIEEIRRRGADVLLCAFEALPIYGWDYTRSFRQVFPDLARRYAVPLVPFILAGVLGRRNLLLPDLVHPNAQGARVIADAIWPHVREVLSRHAPDPESTPR